MQGNEFVVACRGTKASTHVKLNALLDAANGGRYYREPFTMSVHTELPAAEIEAMHSRLSVHYAREE